MDDYLFMDDFADIPKFMVLFHESFCLLEKGRAFHEVLASFFVK